MQRDLVALAREGELDEKVRDRPEVRVTEHRHRALHPPHRLARRRQVRQAVAAVALVEDAALLVLDEHEPPDRHVPRALHDRRDVTRVAASDAPELAPRAATVAR